MGLKNKNTSIPFSPSFAVIKFLQKIIKSEEENIKITNDLQPNESKNSFHIIQTDFLNRSTKNPNWSTISMRCKGTKGREKEISPTTLDPPEPPSVMGDRSINLFFVGLPGFLRSLSLPNEIAQALILPPPLGF